MTNVMRKLQSWPLFICGFVFSVSSFVATAQTQAAAAVAPAAIAARLNGAPIYQLTLETLWRSKQQREPAINQAAMLEQIIGNRLLAQTAHTKFKQYDLYSAARVAFARDVMLEDQLVAQLRAQHKAQLEAALQALPGGNLEGAVKERHAITAEQFEQIFGSENRMILEYSLTPQQMAKAKQVPVLQSKLVPGGTLNLADLIKRQNVQGRIEFFNRNQDFIRQQAQLKLANLFVINWAKQHFGAAAVNDLQQALADQEDVRLIFALHGIGHDIDSESELLKQLAKAVSQIEVERYYQAHKEEFKRIAQVKARHIRVQDEEKAKLVLQQAQSGMSFVQLARKYSQAPDAKDGGDLGWLKHDGKADWLAELAFIQEPGKISAPFRAAVGPNEAAYYEILLVEQREDGYHAANSETVRYQAAQVIAREKAAMQLSALQKQLLRQAKIDIIHSGKV